MKIINNQSRKSLQMLFITLISLILTSIISIKVTFNTQLQTLNLALQKALLSQDDFQVANIYSKFHKMSTESLFIDNQSCIYESGKINEINLLLKKSYPSNNVLKTIPLGKLFKVKGIAKCLNVFYQLTGFNRKVFRYTFPSLDILTPISTDLEIGEAEGLAQLSDEFLIASNGSNKIFVLDCKNDLNILKIISVEDNNGDEFHGIKDIVVVGEYVYALKANDNRVIKINPKTGKIVKFYNMMNLVDFELKTKSLTDKDISQGSAAMSGITFDQNSKMFVVTGKNWGHYYEVDLK